MDYYRPCMFLVGRFIFTVTNEHNLFIRTGFLLSRPCMLYHCLRLCTGGLVFNNFCNGYIDCPRGSHFLLAQSKPWLNANPCIYIHDYYQLYGIISDRSVGLRRVMESIRRSTYILCIRYIRRSRPI